RTGALQAPGGFREAAGRGDAHEQPEVAKGVGHAPAFHFPEDYLPLSAPTRTRNRPQQLRQIQLTDWTLDHGRPTRTHRTHTRATLPTERLHRAGDRDPVASVRGCICTAHAP